MTRVEKQRRTLARKIKEDPRRVQAVKAQFVDRLMRSGVIVDLDIGRWRGMKQLRKEDLGLNGEAFETVRHLIAYGHKRLLPASYANRLNSLEAQVRQNLDRHGFRTAFGVFVPATAYEAWKKAHAELARAYEQTADEIVSRYASIKTTVVAEYEAAAKDALTVARAVSEERPKGQPYIAAYLDRIRAAFPEKEHVRDSFRCDYTLSFIPLTSTVLAEEKAQAKIAAEAQMQDELRAHYLGRKRMLVDRFLQDVVGQLRGLVHGVCDDVVTSIKKNDRLMSRSAVQLRNLLERVQQLNVYGDTEITSQLQAVVNALDVKPKKGQAAAHAQDIEARLVDLQAVCQEAVSGAVNVHPLLERFMALEIGDEVMT